MQGKVEGVENCGVFRFYWWLLRGKRRVLFLMVDVLSWFLRLFDILFFFLNCVFIILFLAAHGLSVGAASRGCFRLQSEGLSLWRLFRWALRSCGLRWFKLSGLVWHGVLVALWHVKSSQTRDWTRVSCIAWWIPYHCTAREVCLGLCGRVTWCTWIFVPFALN